MAIDLDTVRKLANLARLETSEAELQKLSEELGSILEYVSVINSALTDGDITISYPTINVLREDVVTTETGSYTNDLLALAPHSENGFVKVKKIM